MRLNVDVPKDYSDEQLNDLAQEHLQAFYRRFAGQAAFIEYFRKEWAPKIGKRLSALPSNYQNYRRTGPSKTLEHMCRLPPLCAQVFGANCIAMSTIVIKTPLAQSNHTTGSSRCAQLHYFRSNVQCN